MSQFKQFIRAAGILLISFGGVQSVSALPLCEGGPGINLVSGCLSEGNDSTTAVENAITGATGATVNIMLYGKSDDSTPGLFDITGSLGGLIEDDLDGTWDVLDDTISIAYLTVKAGNFFTLYDVQGVNSGTWTTEGILTEGDQQPALSHLSFWTADEPAQVPEPGSLALLGLGLIGLRFARRHSKTA